MKFLGFLLELLGRTSRPGPRGRATAEETPGRRPRRAVGAAEEERGGGEAFEQRLRALALERGGTTGTVVAGRLQMIGLSRLRDRFGARWADVADKAHALARRVLDRRLADEDVYLRAGEDRYLVLFATLSGEEAAFKAQAVAREISARLMGELPEIEDFPVNATVHEVAAAELAGASNVGTLVAALDRRAGARPGEEETKEKPARASPAPEEEKEVGWLRLSYAPVWSRHGGAVILYNCVPAWHTGDGGQSTGDRELGLGGDGSVPDLDRSTLQAVVAALETMACEGHAALVVAPVHWTTLARSQTRRDYLALCREVSPSLRRQLGFSVVGVPPSAWRMTVIHHLAPLYPFTRFLCAGVSPHPCEVARFVGTGVRALTFDATDFDAADATRHELVKGFVRQANAQRMTTSALGVATQGTARALLAAGVDFLAGDVVAPAADAPGAAYKRSDPSGTCTRSYAIGGMTHA